MCLFCCRQRAFLFPNAKNNGFKNFSLPYKRYSMSIFAANFLDQ